MTRRIAGATTTAELEKVFADTVGDVAADPVLRRRRRPDDGAARRPRRFGAPPGVDRARRRPSARQHRRRAPAGLSACRRAPRRSQDVVLEATLDVIAEQGVIGVSVDTVAARSGVSKATIYRHWGSRARLIHAAISSLQQPVASRPDTGSLRERPRRCCSRTSSTTSTRPTVARVFPSFIDAAVRDPELAELRQETLRMGRAELRAGRPPRHRARRTAGRRRRRARRRPGPVPDHLPAGRGPGHGDHVRRGPDRRRGHGRLRHRPGTELNCSGALPHASRRNGEPSAEPRLRRCSRCPPRRRAEATPHGRR